MAGLEQMPDNGAYIVYIFLFPLFFCVLLDGEMGS